MLPRRCIIHPLSSALFLSCRLHRHSVAVVRTPDTSDTGVLAGYGLPDPLELVAVGVAQRLGVLQDLQGLQVLHAEGSRPSVDVVADNVGVVGGLRGDGDLDLRVGGGELGQLRLEKTAVDLLASRIVSPRDVDAYFMPFELPAQSQ